MKIVYDLGIAKIFQKYILTAQQIIPEMMKKVLSKKGKSFLHKLSEAMDYRLLENMHQSEDISDSILITRGILPCKTYMKL